MNTNSRLGPSSGLAVVLAAVATLYGCLGGGGGDASVATAGGGGGGGGGGGASTCAAISTGVAGAVTASVTANRTTGVAPLAVFFDATGTTSTSTVADTHFHHLMYVWDFKDTGAGNWGRGATVGTASPYLSKNAATGGVSAHVFESAGTYEVQVTVTDNSGNTSTACSTITVTDADTTYAGTATRCYAQDGVFTGCPAGAAQIGPADLTQGANVTAQNFKAVVEADLATGRRLLFKRGETWLTTAQTLFNVNGPWTVGAFGAGAKPVVQRSGGVTLLTISSSGSAAGAKSDGRVMDLTIDGNNAGTNGITGAGSFDNLTLLRLDLVNTDYGLNFNFTASNLTKLWNGLTIADSTVLINPAAPGGNNGMFVAGDRMAILGSSVDNQGGGEHNFRSMYWNRLVVAHNNFSRPAPTKATFTLRAPQFDIGSGPASNPTLLPPGTYSEFGVVSDNVCLLYTSRCV